MSTILLVDDNPADRALFRRILSEGGHTVHELARGGDVLARVRELRPHVIVLDVKLPDLDGHEVCRALRADPRTAGIPVLILTVLDQRDDVLAGLSAGADDYVAKDEAPEIVLARVDRLASYVKLASVTMLNEQLAQVGRLLAGIVHEIRSPLSVIRGHAELIQLLMPENVELQELIEPILRSSLLLQSRLEHLMAAVRTGPAAPKLVEVAAVVREATELFGRGVDPRRRKVRVSVEAAEDTPPAILDAGRLIQALLNVLANAYEAILGHGDEGTITIRVDSVRRDESDWIRVAVSDDGPGVPAHILPRLFEPFFTTKEEGTGYGLYLAHQIVEEQGGRLEACNVSSGGACFSIWLPVATEAATVSEEA
jgi:signal transduction histidine kinase